MAPLAFLDTETTGLDPTRHEVWEVGLVLRTEDGAEAEYLWQLPVDAGKADTMGLTIGRFHERRWPDVWPPDGAMVNQNLITDMEAQERAVLLGGSHGWAKPGVVPGRMMDEWADRFSRLTWGAHLVGAVPSFDAAFLGPLLRKHGACPGWHYHLVDVEAMAAGALQQEPPWDSEELSNEIGVDPEKFDRHTALGDARWAMAVYDAVVTVPTEED